MPTMPTTTPACLQLRMTARVAKWFYQLKPLVQLTVLESVPSTPGHDRVTVTDTVPHALVHEAADHADHWQNA